MWQKNADISKIEEAGRQYADDMGLVRHIALLSELCKTSGPGEVDPILTRHANDLCRKHGEPSVFPVWHSFDCIKLMNP